MTVETIKAAVEEVDLATAEPETRSQRGGKASQAGGKTVGAVAAAVKILRHLANSPEPLGVSRIAKPTKINTSTCFNILRTLAAEDLVNFDPLSKTYTISLGIMDLARGATALGGDLSAIRPSMERIANEHGVTLTLWQPIGDNRKVLVYSALSRSAMRIQMAVGQRLPMLIGATGRVFAAYSDLGEEELRNRFQQIHWDSPLSFAEFKRQIKQTRERGWAIDDGNFATGTISLAVPILNREGKPVMALTATMFSGQYAKRSEDLLHDLQEFCQRVSRIVSED